jgi:mitochondrial import receptor subunit TOM40
MNSVRSLTRKVDHLNGFRFELGGSLSNNLHLTGTINMPNPTLPKKASPFGMPPSDSKGDFQLGIQYLHGPVSQVQQPKLIMTGRVDTSGKVESVIMKKLTDGVNLRFNAGFLNSDVNYAQAGFDLNFDDPEC